MSAPSVLFDAPGPKARAMYRALSVVGLLVFAGLAWLVISRLAAADQLTAAKWSPFVHTDIWRYYLLPGLRNTLTAAVLAIILSGLFGIIFGMGRLSTHRPIRWVSGVVVEFFRSVPVLILMFMLYLGVLLPAQFPTSSTAPLVAVVLALMLYNGSVIAELVRSGVHSLPNGQGEAGLSIGLTPAQTLRSIQLPQALTAMLPALISQFVVILKDTALGVGITFNELLNSAKTASSANANTIPAYIVAAIIFILINYSLTRFAVYVEGRLKRSSSTTALITGPDSNIVQADGDTQPGKPATNLGAIVNAQITTGGEEAASLGSDVEKGKRRPRS